MGRSRWSTIYILITCEYNMSNNATNNIHAKYDHLVSYYHLLLDQCILTASNSAH